MRKYYIDNIRSWTIILVVIYHVIYMFNSVITDGVIGPITKANGVDVVQYLLYPWFMVILFIISGMCSKYYLEKHTEKGIYQGTNQKIISAVYHWLAGFWMDTGIL